MPESAEDIIAATLYRDDPQICGVREKATQIAVALRDAGWLIFVPPAKEADRA